MLSTFLGVETDEVQFINYRLEVPMTTVASMLRLEGRKALITGGNGKIGQAAAATFLELGARVALVDLPAANFRSTAEQINGFTETDSLILEVDLADEVATREVVAQAGEELGGIDIVVHSAAYVGTTAVPGWAVPFEEQQVKPWDAALRINLTAPFVIAQAARHLLKASGHGSVIFLASIYGLTGPDMRLYAGTRMGNPAGYNASKGGLLQLMRYLATVLAPEIRVNAISPGGVWRSQPEEFVTRYSERTPLGRMAREEDLKGAFAYLASDLSQYVTGHNLVVDGGWTAW